MIPIESMRGKKGKGQKTMAEAPVAKVAEYAGEDADFTWRLYERFQETLSEPSLKKLFSQVEMPLIKVLARMEKNGVKIDSKFLADFSQKLAKQIVAVRDKIYELAGGKFNINSPQ